jgi:hypothetical protein
MHEGFRKSVAAIGRRDGRPDRFEALDAVWLDTWRAMDARDPDTAFNSSHMVPSAK